MAVAFKTKNEAVYERLRHDIIDGKLKPGQRIVISDLSKEFGFSEIPIREAIRRLDSEGLLQVTPHVGTIVTEIDEKEVTEIYLIRIELESLAAKLATPHISETDLDFLDKKNQEMELAISKHNYEKLGLLNKDFHLRIYRAAPYPLLFKLIVDLWEKVQRTRSVFALVPKRAIASVEEHRKITEALRSKDADLVERLVRQQKENSMKTLVDYLGKDSELMMRKSGSS
jgi:DNA-binding GntR family transcriptional regulator